MTFYKFVIIAVPFCGTKIKSLRFQELTKKKASDEAAVEIPRQEERPMALWDDAMKGSLPTILIGIGAALAAPIVLPAAAAGLRPLTKTLIKGGLYVADSVKELMAEASEQFSDLVAEARAEQTAEAATAAATGAASAETEAKPS